MTQKEKWIEDTELAYALELALRAEITHPCSYHPSGRNHLFLNPQERQEIVKRIFKVLGKDYE